MAKKQINYDRDILLVADKKSGRLKAVAGMSEDGKTIKTVEPSMRNERMFLTVEKNSAGLEKFFKSFLSRTDDPSGTAFYRMPVNGLEMGVSILAGLLEGKLNPGYIAESRIRPQDYAGAVREHDPKVLLTLGDDGKLKALAEGKDGKLKTVEPDRGNADSFLSIDTHGNALENFFKKFSAQFNRPSHTGVFAVSAKAVDRIAAFLDRIISVNPDDRALDPYRVKPGGQAQEQQKYQPMDLNRLDWKEVDRLGILGEALQDALKAMVYGHKSPGLLKIRMEMDGMVYENQARLSLEPQPDGTIKIQTHLRQEKPDFDKPFMGVMLTEADKEQLMKTGHGGRVFDLEPVPGGGKVPSLVSLDRLINRLEAVPLSEINIPQTLKNAPLSPEQQQGLREGKAVRVEGMDKRIKPGEEPKKIDRFVQFNAVNRNFDFRFNPEQKQQHKEEQQAKREQQPGQARKERKGQFAGDIWVPKVLLGVKLSDEQFQSILAGKPAWVEGMTTPKPRRQQGETQVEATDGKGQKFNAWVRPEQEAGKLKYYRWNPEESPKQGRQAKPAEGYKTQVAVNSEGKTNEATKHSSQPLKTGQSLPDEEQQQQQRHPIPKPKKNTGHKM